MMEDNNKLDDLFREEFSDYSEMPPARVWEALEKRLDKDKKRRIFPFGWYWIGGLIGIAMLVSGMFVWSSRQTRSSRGMVAHTQDAVANLSTTPKVVPVAAPVIPATAENSAIKVANHHTPASPAHLAEHRKHIRHASSKHTNTAQLEAKEVSVKRIVVSRNAPATGTSIYSYDMFEDSAATHEEVVVYTDDNVREMRTASSVAADDYDEEESDKVAEEATTKNTSRESMITAPVIPNPGHKTAKLAKSQMGTPTSVPSVAASHPLASKAVQKTVPVKQGTVAAQPASMPVAAALSAAPKAKHPVSATEVNRPTTASVPGTKTEVTKLATAKAVPAQVKLPAQQTAVATVPAPRAPVKNDVSPKSVAQPIPSAAKPTNTTVAAMPAIAANAHTQNKAATQKDTKANQPTTVAANTTAHITPKSNSGLSASISASRSHKSSVASAGPLVSTQNPQEPNATHSSTGAKQAPAQAQKEQAMGVVAATPASLLRNRHSGAAKAAKPVPDTQSRLLASTSNSPRVLAVSKTKVVVPVQKPATTPPAVAAASPASSRVGANEIEQPDLLPSAPPPVPAALPLVASSSKPAEKVDSLLREPEKQEAADTAASDKQSNSRFLFGLKGGLEGSANSGSTGKIYFAPYLQYKLNDKLSLMVQPTVKFAYMGKRQIGNTSSYYNVHPGTTKYSLIDSDLVTIAMSGDSMWRRNYASTEQYDSISKTYTMGGGYFEVELPILLNYKLSSRLSVYGGLSMGYSKVLGIKESTSSEEKTANGNTATLGALFSPAPAITTTGIKYSGTPISNYSGPAYPGQGSGLFRMGCMLGVSYELRKRWSLDAALQKSFVPAKIEGGYNTHAGLSATYFRIGIGYRLSK